MTPSRVLCNSALAPDLHSHLPKPKALQRTRSSLHPPPLSLKGRLVPICGPSHVSLGGLAPTDCKRSKDFPQPHAALSLKERISSYYRLLHPMIFLWHRPVPRSLEIWPFILALCP